MVPVRRRRTLQVHVALARKRTEVEAEAEAEAELGAEVEAEAEAEAGVVSASECTPAARTPRVYSDVYSGTCSPALLPQRVRRSQQSSGFLNRRLEAATEARLEAVSMKLVNLGSSCPRWQSAPSVQLTDLEDEAEMAPAQRVQRTGEEGGGGAAAQLEGEVASTSAPTAGRRRRSSQPSTPRLSSPQLEGEDSEVASTSAPTAGRRRRSSQPSTLRLSSPPALPVRIRRTHKSGGHGTQIRRA